MFTLPFGKYKGEPIDRVPAGYLGWLLDNAESLYPETREAIESYLGREPTAERPPQETGRAAAARSRPHAAKATGEPATCGRCGMPGSEARPLVHADCASDDEVPF